MNFVRKSSFCEFDLRIGFDVIGKCGNAMCNL